MVSDQVVTLTYSVYPYGGSSPLPPANFNMKKLIELTKHLKAVRENQPRVTLKEAQEQAKRVMAAKKYGRRLKQVFCPACHNDEYTRPPI
jgi:ribosomal protein S30